MRGDDGRFGRGTRKNISGTHRFKRGPAIAQQVARQGGITYQPTTNRQPKRGFAVAIPGAQQKIDRHTFNADDVESFIAEHKAWFKNPHVYLGIWDDGDTMWLELSEVHPNSASALRVGKARGEIAVFDLAKGEDVHVEPQMKNVKTKAESVLTPEQYGLVADKLMAQAEADAPAFLDDVQAAADANDGQLTDVAKKNAVKTNRDRIVEKMGKKQGMPPSDILRSTILVDDPEGSLDGILASFKERGYSVWVDPRTGREDITNRYSDGSIGYKDVAIKLVKGDNDALVKELLILSPKMSEAKYELGGHELYEQIRAKGHATSLEEVNAMHALELQMNELYQQAEMDENVQRYLNRATKVRPELRQRAQEALRELNSRHDAASSLNSASVISRPWKTTSARFSGSPHAVAAVAPPDAVRTTLAGTFPSQMKYRGYVGSGGKGTPHRTASIASAKRDRRQ